MGILGSKVGRTGQFGSTIRRNCCSRPAECKCHVRPPFSYAPSDSGSASLLILLKFLFWSFFFLPTFGAGQLTPGPPHRSDIPSELQVSDPNIKRILDDVDSSTALGKRADCPPYFARAIDLATRDKSLADRGIVEDKFAAYYFTQGKLDDAKSQWIRSLSDGVAVSNLVLQADDLVALSGLEQASGHPDRAMQLITEASEVARKSKNLYILSRALGELTRVQLLAGKLGNARSSIEEAIQLDDINQYEWKAYHLLVEAWVNAAESNIDKAIELAASARTLAIKNENYLVFIQASQFLGQADVHTGQTDRGIRILELAQKGLSDQNEPIFRSPDRYAQAVSLPYIQTIFLEALSLAYEAAHRYDDALSSWQRLYDSAATVHFSLAEAESARHLADLYKSRKEFGKAIDSYSLAAQACAIGGDKQGRIQMLSSEASLLAQQGQRDRALDVLDQVLSLTKSPETTREHFIANLASCRGPGRHFKHRSRRSRIDRSGRLGWPRCERPEHSA